MDAGQLVPDEVTNAMVADRLAQPDVVPGFLLDGYPRNLDQADVLAGLPRLSAAPRSTPSSRSSSTPRTWSRGCCARGQGRADDTEEVIRHRLEVYASETAPLVDYYRERGLLRTVDGVGSVDDVTARILAVLSA